MTSVLRGRYLAPAFFLLTFGLLVAAGWGCRPAEEEQASADANKQAPSTPATDPGKKPSSVDQKPGEKQRGDKEPGNDDRKDEKPKDQKPKDEKPKDEKPKDEKPKDQKPKDQKPKDEKPVEKDPAEDAASDKKLDPTDDIVVKWLPDPIGVPEAMVETEEDMKPYTELIPATDVTFEMLPIPGGKFIMGSPEDEEGHWLKDDKGDQIKDEQGNKVSDEGPQHEVVIEPFWMGKCEVTWDEYELWGVGLDKQRRDMKRKKGEQPTEREKLVDAVARPTNPYVDMTFNMGKEGYPAICMTQLAAKGYCRWLSAKTGRFYRLPTEAEWEYACRAGTKTAYSFGDDPDDLDDYAWYFDNSEVDGEQGYQKVGRKKPNRWGLYDMHGNISEWVLDQYIPDLYKQFAGQATGSPLAVPKTLYPRAVRGGCWDDDPEQLRSAARRGSTIDWNMQDPQIPQSIWYHTETNCPGFRVVRPLRVPTVEEAKKYEWDARAIHEYKEAQAGKE